MIKRELEEEKTVVVTSNEWERSTAHWKWKKTPPAEISTGGFELCL